MKKTKTDLAVESERARCIRLVQSYIIHTIPYQTMEHVTNIGLLLNAKDKT